MPTMLLKLALLFLITGVCNAHQYIPGEPGAPWSQEEVMIVKSKLYSVFMKSYWAMNQIFPDGYCSIWTRLPDAPKVLRLGFHDCIKYTDGTGGCDGCLNWEGVGVMFDQISQGVYPIVDKTNNNGLECTVYLLEQIYINASFPLNMAPALDVSLRDSGKSRADLWALATIAAVEFGIENNNQVCDGTYDQDPNYSQCNEASGTPECKVNLERKIQFQTGRRDCTEFGDETFQATKEESHPNPAGNGQMTVDFFAKDFDLNGREIVALMGAHTMGRLNFDPSLYRYVWTSRGEKLFNNGYYKNIVAEDRYPFSDNQCTLVTDARGNKPRTRWLTFVLNDTVNGGPVQWVHENYVCPNCFAKPADNCCHNVPDDDYCIADSDTPETDDDLLGINQGCERFRFITGLDETALPAEIGLYFDFQVTPGGIPYGCPGFEYYNATYWGQGWHSLFSTLPYVEGSTSMWQRERADPGCTKNTLESGSGPLYQVFHEYAENQDVWVRDFVEVLEKMLRNGYGNDELVNGPDQYTNVECPRDGKWDFGTYTSCFHTTDTLLRPRFVITSRQDGRALKGLDNGQSQMWTLDTTDPRQLWVESLTGHQFLNVETGLPLVDGYNGRSWVSNGVNLANSRSPSTVLMRENAMVDGAIVFSVGWGPQPWPVMQWDLVYV